MKDKTKMSFRAVGVMAGLLLACLAGPARGATPVAAKDLTQVTNMLGSEYAVVVVGTNARLIKITNLAEVLKTNGVAITNYDALYITNKIEWPGTGQFLDWRLGTGANSVRRHDWIQGGLNGAFEWWERPYANSNKMMSLDVTTGSAYKLKMFRQGGFVDASNYGYGGFEQTATGFQMGTWRAGSETTNGQVVTIYTDGTARMTINQNGAITMGSTLGVTGALSVPSWTAGYFSCDGNNMLSIEQNACVQWSGRSEIRSSANGKIRFSRNGSSTNFNAVTLGAEDGSHLRIGVTDNGTAATTNGVLYIGPASDNEGTNAVVWADIIREGKGVTDNVATNVVIFDILTNTTAAFTFEYQLESVNGTTDFESRNGEVRVAAVNKAGTVTLAVVENASSVATAKTHASAVTVTWGSSATSTNAAISLTATHASVTTHKLRINLLRKFTSGGLRVTKL